VFDSLMALRLLLADDNAPVRRSLKTLLEREGFEVIGEASDGHQAVSLAGRHRPDVILLDLSMPYLNGIEAARQIRKSNPQARTIILTVHREYHYVLEALEAGARGYILKSRAVEDLANAIHQVAGGEVFLSRGLSQKIVHKA
jgi:two-component system response regulator NreC